MHIEVHGLDVFDGKVGTYPAITVLDRDRSCSTQPHVGKAMRLNDISNLVRHQSTLSDGDSAGSGVAVSLLSGERPAIITSQPNAKVIEGLRHRFPTIEEAGCKIRCGVALGLAKAFVVERGAEGIEAELLLPFLRSQDLKSNSEGCSAKLINPWDDDGQLVPLTKYPGAERHLKQFREALLARVCVRVGTEWYRTIDRIHRSEVDQPKIIVAGIGKKARMKLDAGGCQPSNSLYWITSSNWPLEFLHAFLKAGAVDLFGQVMASRVRGGSKRFDGYLLKQIRLPEWETVSDENRAKLKAATGEVDPGLVAGVYDLAPRHVSAILRQAS
jgi:hypothetical protein